MKKVGGLGSALSGLSGLSSIAGATVSFAGFLDTVSNVEHVYLLFRSLSSYTGSLVRLRRVSDNVEADFAWDSTTQEYLDTAAVTTWLGGSSAVVVTTYDQAAAGDDITQATAGLQPVLTLSDANFNNRPVLTHNQDWLAGVFTTGGSIAQPNTIYTAARWTDLTTVAALYDGDDAANRHQLGKNNANPDKWTMYAGTTLTGAATVDTNSHILSTLFNGASSQSWLDGISDISGNANTQAFDGVSLGDTQAHLANYFIGAEIGLIVIDGNSSTADKNIIGNKLETVYGISYTDIP